MLHTLTATPESAACRDCLRVLVAGDAIVLMGDGVYCALGGSDTLRSLLDTSAHVYVLEADATAAGVRDRIEGASFIGIDGLVTLTEQHSNQQAWY